MLLSFRTSTIKKVSSNFGLYQQNRPNYIITGCFLGRKVANLVRLRTSRHIKKKPIRVVLKAPFHYKVGKHRLTTISYRRYIRIIIANPPAKTPQTPQNIIKSLRFKLSIAPTLTSPVENIKKRNLSINATLTKGVLKIK